jgi:hypothetical protein
MRRRRLLVPLLILAVTGIATGFCAWYSCRQSRRAEVRRAYSYWWQELSRSNHANLYFLVPEEKQKEMSQSNFFWRCSRFASTNYSPLRIKRILLDDEGAWLFFPNEEFPNVPDGPALRMEKGKAGWYLTSSIGFWWNPPGWME